ncbi:Putative type III effector, NUDIX hydrolase domain protein [Anopheles sinensis]|uniref:Putative type III effector, NUDIX hydrolase domain protein n=1 Tax=Anopheles sinensis TaxID=74873 RepID=A0A084WBJ9_ANOSI|nr:Putative type III effector, NUDIX hydrolase domain protein [Anopheles sinensis]
METHHASRIATSSLATTSNHPRTGPNFLPRRVPVPAVIVCLPQPPSYGHSSLTPVRCTPKAMRVFSRETNVTTTVEPTLEPYPAYREAPELRNNGDAVAFWRRSISQQQRLRFAYHYRVENVCHLGHAAKQPKRTNANNRLLGEACKLAGRKAKLRCKLIIPEGSMYARAATTTSCFWGHSVVSVSGGTDSAGKPICPCHPTPSWTRYY